MSQKKSLFTGHRFWPFAASNCKTKSFHSRLKICQNLSDLINHSDQAKLCLMSTSSAVAAPKYPKTNLFETTRQDNVSRDRGKIIVKGRWIKKLQNY